MRTPIIAATILLASSAAAFAAPGRHHDGGGWRGGHDAGRVTPYERAAIASARAHLATVRSRAWRDGRVTFIERYQIRLAEVRLSRTLQWARRG